ncbi:hypothetical protein BKA70DRAFT_1352813, partial [Coprinopsis sp. MPI-PUGE-AT-0042]
MMVRDYNLPPYANSNEPLPDHLRGPLKQFLHQLDAQWDVYEQERRNTAEAIDLRQSMIQALETEMEALNRVKNRALLGQEILRTKQRSYARSVSAVRRISPEVIASIIGFAIQGSNGLLHQEERVFFAQLRSVCRLWRDTSFSTPSLWRAVGLDIGHILARNPSVDVKTYIWDNLTCWLLRAGEGAPVTLQVYGPLPSTTFHIMDFASGTGFNITTLAFCSPDGMQRTGVLSYNAFKVLGIPAPEPLPVIDLTFEFHHLPQFRPSTRDIVDLNKNFPGLLRLCLLESAVRSFVFPLQIVHRNLAELHLASLVLSVIEVHLLLSGLPRLETLQLDHCGTRHVNAHTPFTHLSLNDLVISGHFPEDCFAGLTCPALRSVSIQGPPADIQAVQRPDIGQIFGQFLKRCGDIGPFFLPGGWPSELLENVLDGN